MMKDEGHFPLVVFTTLAVAGAGALIVPALSFHTAAAMNKTISTLGLGLLAAGMATSLLHLGRNDRAYLSARGLAPVHSPNQQTKPPSPVSVEGLAGTATLALGAIMVMGILPAWIQPHAPVAVAITAAGFLLTIGLVYRLKGQLTWTGASAATPLTGGVAFGAILASSLLSPQPAGSLVVFAVSVDAFTFLLRWRHITAMGLEQPQGQGPWFERRHELLAARFLLVDALPLFSLFTWPTPLAAVIAAAGLFIDRFGFYALAIQHTTEAEIGRVERLLGRDDPP
jgi:DMSO reductase anchor subunit